MPLIKSNLKSSIREINDTEYTDFKGFPSNTIEVADAWSGIIDSYASKVIPTSTTASAAKAALYGQLLTISSEAANAFLVLQAGITSYAVALAGGMAGAGFVGVPPPAPLILTPVSAIGLAGGSAEACAEAMSSILDIWFKTGSATPVAGGPPIFWT
jgi:hypothetical protein